MATLGKTGQGLAFVILAALAPTAHAFQKPLATWGGQAPEVGFGTVIAAAGDVNGDGVPDVITGAPNSLGLRGAARVISGADGATLFAYANSNPAGKPLDEFGTAVCGCGDLDGDGLAEFAVGQPEVTALRLGGRVRVYRGSDGSVLHEFLATTADETLGFALADAGDLDGDGVDDLAVGGPNANGGSGEVILRSGATGAVIRVIAGSSNPSRFGQALAGAGDFDLDGLPDLVVGAPTYVTTTPFDGAAFVQSGADGMSIAAEYGQAYDRMGFAVAGGFDVDGSGTPDVLLGATQTFGIFIYGSGYAELFSGETHHALMTFPGAGSDETGASVAMADVDLDGHADLLVGEPTWSAPGQFSTGRVRVFSGKDHGLLAEVHGADSAQQCGRAVAAVGDIDHDFASEWAVGTPGVAATMGQVQLFASTSVWTDLGHGLAGVAGTPVATAIGSLQPLAPLELRLTGGPPSVATTLVLGVAPLFAPFKGGTLVPVPTALQPGLPLDADGDFTLAGTWPAGLSPGFSCWLQFWTPDAGAAKGLSASNGLSGTAP